MKKIFILTFIFSMTFLASCSTQENIENTTTTNSGKNLQSEIKTETENKEITNTGTIQEEPIKEVKKIRSIAIENFNVVLKEDGKTINKLTTKATGQKECKWDKDIEKYYIYNIIADNGSYGIVKKEAYNCGAGRSYSYFGIDLEKNTELTEIWAPYYIEAEVKEKLENNILKFTILEPQFIVKISENRGDIGIDDLEKEGFKKEGNDWVKTIDLKDIIKTEIKKEEKVEIQKIEDPKLDLKYSDENLKKNGYKLNNLGNIKEYYKEEITPESEEYGRGFITRKTIYIEGNKVLDFEINNWGGQNLIIKTPISTEIAIQEYGNGYELQKVFGGNIIITDINTIKIGDKIIWSR